MRPRTNSRSRDLLSDQPITIIELQQLLKGVEDRIQLKNDLILANINKLEKQLNYLQNKQNNLSSNTPTNLYLPPILSFCGLTQEQLDLYKWVDVNSGRCLAKYCNSEGNELTCNQLYTSHERYQSFYSSLQSTNNINTTMNNNSNNTTSLDLPIPPIPQTSNSSTSTISTTSTSISSNNNDTNTVESKSLNKKSSSISKSSNTISNEVNPDIKREAAARIQRLASRRRAWKTAEAEREWKIFSDLNSQDEADMLNLASFMQTLLNWMSDSPEDSNNNNNKKKSSSSSSSSSSSLSNRKMELTRRLSREYDDNDQEEESSGEKVNLDSIQLSMSDSFSPEDINNFTLPKSSITPEMVNNVLSLYRKKGKLSSKSLQRILREIYTPLKSLRNISYIQINNEDKLTIVGDLHGQLGDLFYILDQNGLPSSTNKYLFNGDFVDRGKQSIEVIVIILMLYAAYPNCIYLNRGNHEDESICRIYGFERECKEKYDDLIFGMFAEVFRHIPLFAIVNHSIFIVHGGLFHNEDILLSELEQIDRFDYIAKPQIPYPDCIANIIEEEEKYKEYLKQLQRDALWSDPSSESGIINNQRGAGIKFGSDVVEKFLKNNNLNMIIRSHECVRKGFDLPFSGQSKNLLGTIFSASNYCGGYNDAAYIIITTHRLTQSTPIYNYQNQINDNNVANLFYIVNRFKTSDVMNNLNTINKISLFDLIFRKKKTLQQEFEINDQELLGKLTKLTFIEVMQKVTQLKIFWLTTIQNLVPTCISGNYVLYNEFLNYFTLDNNKIRSSNSNLLTISSIYGQKNKLEQIFQFFDTNGDGIISREEFRKGCDYMNLTLPPDKQLKNYDYILTMMDFDHNDSIDLNEFFEVFRILDAKDGVVDGVISIGNP